MFDITRFINNVNSIIAIKGYKVGDVEKKAGVSVGYLSKLISRGSEGGPATSITVNLANVLGVSVEQLVEGDYSKVDSGLATLMEFIDKLNLDTDNSKLEWTSYKIYQINEMLDKEYYDEEYIEQFIPFMVHKKEDDLPFKDVINEHDISKDKGKYFQITSFENPDLKVYCAGPAFYTNLDLDTRVWLIKGCAITSKNIIERFYEMYISKRTIDQETLGYYGDASDAYYWVKNPLYSTLKKLEVVNKNVEILYETLLRHDNDFKMSEEVKKAIIDYLEK